MIVGVIPARLGSIRFPRKILVPLAGKPLIAHVVEQTMKSEKLDKVILAIDSEETKEVSFFDKAKLFFTKKSKEKIEDVKKNVKKMASEKIKKKTKSEDSDEDDEKHQEEQEKLFTKKTKMTLLQAEKKVKKWNEAGETKKVKAGVKMILEFFPNHEFRKMNLSKNKSKKIEEIEEGEEGQTKKRKKKSLFAKVAANPSHGFDVSPEFLEQNGLPQEADVNDDERVFGALSYFPLLSLFVLATRKDSEFAMYHAWQGFAILAIFLVSLPFFWIFSFMFAFLCALRSSCSLSLKMTLFHLSFIPFSENSLFSAVRGCGTASLMPSKSWRKRAVPPTSCAYSVSCSWYCSFCLSVRLLKSRIFSLWCGMATLYPKYTGHAPCAFPASG